MSHLYSLYSQTSIIHLPVQHFLHQIQKLQCLKVKALFSPSLTGILLYSFLGLALLIGWLITSTAMYGIEDQLHAVDTGHTLMNTADVVPMYSPMK